MATTHTTEWTIQPNEAFDMVLFINAISNNDFYRRHYQGVRENYSIRLGEEGLNLIDQVASAFSMSGLCKLFSYFQVNSLNDVIYCLQNFERLITNVELEEKYIKQLAEKRYQRRKNYY